MHHLRFFFSLYSLGRNRKKKSVSCNLYPLLAIAVRIGSDSSAYRHCQAENVLSTWCVLLFAAAAAALALLLVPRRESVCRRDWLWIFVCKLISKVSNTHIFRLIFSLSMYLFCLFCLFFFLEKPKNSVMDHLMALVEYNTFCGHDMGGRQGAGNTRRRALILLLIALHMRKNWFRSFEMDY